MEVAVQVLGLVLRLLDLVLTAVVWLRSCRRTVSEPTPRLLSSLSPLLLRSAVQLAADVRSGQTTSEELVYTYIQRVKEVNPYLNAVADERYSAALKDAKKADWEIREAKINGSFDELVKTKPLLGVPFTVKESCSVADLSLTVGLVEQASRRARMDGGAVRALRAAGAIPLLVTATPELCLGWETASTLNGTTNNPHDLRRTPGGSSGGEAALLACGASAFGVGSDIAGSIRLPAAFCGVFGYKPTPGIIPIDNHEPMVNDEKFPKFLTVGPITRTAEDLMLLLEVMAGQQRAQLRLDTLVHLEDLKVYYMTEASSSPALLPTAAAIKRAVLDAAHYLGQECGSKVSQVKLKDLAESIEVSMTAFFSMQNIPNLLQDPIDPKRDKSFLVEMLRLAFGTGTRSIQGLSFALIEKTRLFIPNSSRDRYEALEKRLSEQFQVLLGDNGVFLYPVFCDVAHHHNQILTRASGVVYTMLFNILGMPAVSVPMGTHRGLPLAVQVIAAPHQDRLCLAVARQLEKGFGGWRALVTAG